MADIKPFKAILYNRARIRDLSKVVSPPYDVISKKEQGEFYRNSPYNIIRLLLGREFRSDTPLNNKYIRAKRYFLRWLSEGILTQDNLPSIYVYHQEFLYRGLKKMRLGFIALLKLEAPGFKNIFPHEDTMDGPKEDRLRLLKNVRANLSPIFVLFSDKGKRLHNILKENIKESPPFLKFKTKDSVRHTLWRIDDPVQIQRIKRLMQNKEVFIADGHHRYEVALEFSRKMKKSRFGFIMSYFAAIEDEGVVILPVHRMVQGIYQDRAFEILKQRIQGAFLLSQFNSRHSLVEFLTDERRSHRFGVYLGKRGFWGLDAIKAFGKNALDVDILQRFILKPLLDRESKDIKLEFTKDLDFAIEWVDESHKRLAFFLIPTKISQVQYIARLGKRLSQKATYFYPKPLSGLVINRF